MAKTPTLVDARLLLDAADSLLDQTLERAVSLTSASTRTRYGVGQAERCRRAEDAWGAPRVNIVPTVLFLDLLKTYGPSR